MSRLRSLLDGYRDRDCLQGMLRAAERLPDRDLSRTELSNAMARRLEREAMARQITAVVGSYGPLQAGELNDAVELLRRAR